MLISLFFALRCWQIFSKEATMAKAARATISDVAKAAKTGKTSISRYLNGEKHLLSDDLLSRIEKPLPNSTTAPA